LPSFYRDKEITRLGAAAPNVKERKESSLTHPGALENATGLKPALRGGLN